MSTTGAGGAGAGVRALSWVLGVIAGAATLWLLFLLITVAVEWSGYVGHESSTALAITTVVGIVPAAIAWTAFVSVRLLARHASRPSESEDEG